MKLLLVVVFFCITSCQYQTTQKSSPLDSLAGIPINASERERLKDSMISDAVSGRYIKASAKCPVQIVSCKISLTEFGSNQIKYKLKNVSNKTVDGIKVGANLFNNFGDDLTVGFDAFSGISQHLLKPEQSSVYVWDLIGYQSATKSTPFIKEIHFKDGSKWEATN